MNFPFQVKKNKSETIQFCRQVRNIHFLLPSSWNQSFVHLKKMAPNLKVFKLFKFQIRSNFKFNRRLKFNEIHPNGGLMCSTSINPLHRTYFQYLTVVNVYSMICLPWHPTPVDMAVIRSRRRSLISPPTPPITVISWCQTRGAQQLKENSALCC
jgi:hypothetical protein